MTFTRLIHLIRLNLQFVLLTVIIAGLLGVAFLSLRFDQTALLTRKLAKTPEANPIFGNQCQVVPVTVPIFALAYFPRASDDPKSPLYNRLDPAETGWTRENSGDKTISDWEVITQKQLVEYLNFTGDATRYHQDNKYNKDPAAPQYLHFSLVMPLQKIYTPIPRGFPNSDTAHRPYYRQILTDAKICNLVDGQGVREVWLFGYHHEQTIVPDETRMASRFGDISNSFPHENQLDAAYRLPVCNHTYTVYGFTYIPSADIENMVHNRMHQIENVMSFTENRWPPTPENIPGSIFWGNFSEYVTNSTIHNYTSSCGNAHYAPNWRAPQDAYDYALPEPRTNDCEDWAPNVDLAQTVNDSCSQWGCTTLGFYHWFMQNMPGYNNHLALGERSMRNWWEAAADFDSFETNRSLFGSSIYPCQTVVPQPSPTPDPKTIHVKLFFINQDSPPEYNPHNPNPEPTTTHDVEVKWFATQANGQYIAGNCIVFSATRSSYQGDCTLPDVNQTYGIATYIINRDPAHFSLRQEGNFTIKPPLSGTLYFNSVYVNQPSPAPAQRTRVNVMVTNPNPNYFAQILVWPAQTNNERYCMDVDLGLAAYSTYCQDQLVPGQSYFLQAYIRQKPPPGQTLGKQVGSIRSPVFTATADQSIPFTITIPAPLP